VEGLIYTSHPRSRVRPFGSHLCPPPLQHTPVRARARCRTRPRLDTCPHRNGCARIAFHPCEDTVFAPGPTRPHPFTRVCAQRVCARSRRRAKSPRPAPRVRAWNPRPAPPVHAQSYPPTPISTCSRPTRSRFYQRAHASNRAGDQCAPAVISCWHPLQPRAPPAVYKPVRAPS
jgi:hypothetical protein